MQACPALFSIGNENGTHPENSEKRGSCRGGACRGGSYGSRSNRGYGHSSGSVSSTYHGSRGAQATGKTLPKPQQRFLNFAFIENLETIRLLPHFRVMFILRGLPGSGKSTVADAILQQYTKHAVVCSADYYRYNKEGEYVWDRNTLQDTHNKCQRRAEKFAALSKPIITVGKSIISIIIGCIHYHRPGGIAKACPTIT